MTKYSFDERGLPTLAQKWDGSVPDVGEFTVHQSGRRARGELEAIVDMVVKRWLTSPELFEDVLCTAEWLRGQVTAYDGKPTSNAAIAHVLNRWVSVGYATVRKNPVRFVDLTQQGRDLGRAELYRREKRRRNQERDRIRRGERV